MCYSQILLALQLMFVPRAQAAINQAINFQGKVVNSNGTNIADGTYNMQFKLYTGGDGVVGGGDETLQWTEERLRNDSNGVTITDGIFQVNLGSVTALPDIFNNATIWLSMNVGNTNATCTPFSGCSGDGEMSPMIRMTSAPYALNADKLDGLDSTAFGQLAANNSWTGTNMVQVASATAFQIQNASSKGVLTVDTSGDQVVLGKAGASGLAGKLVFNTATASSYTVTLVAGTNTASYSLTLPTAAPSTSQCVGTDSVTASQLIFTTCGSGGAALDTLTAATGDAAILSGDNTIIWEWALTSATSRGLTIGESAASSGGLGNQFLLELTTDSTSTAGPLSIISNSADAGDIEFDLNSAGDFLVMDAGTPFATFADSGAITFAPTSGQSLTNTIAGAGTLTNTISGSGNAITNLSSMGDLSLFW